MDAMSALAFRRDATPDLLARGARELSAPRCAAWRCRASRSSAPRLRPSTRGFAPIRPATPATSPERIGERRVVFFGATILLAFAAAATPFTIYARGGFDPLEMIGLGLFSILILAISCWFCNAVVGLVVLMRGQQPNALGFDEAHTPAPTARTALLMPLYNEDAAAAVARLAATEASLAALVAWRHVDLYVLSDSTKPQVAEAEWEAVTRLAEVASCPVYYRRRAANHERKVGNISEWVRRFGSAYDYMVVLDADSTMSGQTILHLVDAMERHPGVGLIQTDADHRQLHHPIRPRLAVRRAPLRPGRSGGPRLVDRVLKAPIGGTTPSCACTPSPSVLACRCCPGPSRSAAR